MMKKILILLIVKKSITEKITDLLNIYHNLFDGRYKISLSCFYHLLHLIDGNFNKSFEKFLEDDVSYKINEIKKYSGSRLFIETTEWLLLGADSHVRNAIAHKKWKFIENVVELNDRSGWQKKFSLIEIEDLIRSLKIVNRAMESAIIISIVKYYDFIKKHNS